MYVVDNNQTLNRYLADPGRRIPKAHLATVCKCQQAGACRYISLTLWGYVCAKKTPAKPWLDKCVAEGKFGKNGANGDNCPGLGDPLRESLMDSESVTDPNE